MITNHQAGLDQTATDRSTLLSSLTGGKKIAFPRPWASSETKDHNGLVLPRLLGLNVGGRRKGLPFLNKCWRGVLAPYLIALSRGWGTWQLCFHLWPSLPVWGPKSGQHLVTNYVYKCSILLQETSRETISNTLKLQERKRGP